jgi:hypothetical protein
MMNLAEDARTLNPHLMRNPDLLRRLLDRSLEEIRHSRIASIVPRPSGAALFLAE